MDFKACKKRYLLGLVVALIILSISLTGCGSKTGSAGEKTAAVKYPVKPITLVVGFNPGGGVDTNARGIAPYLQKYLGKTVVIDNRSGDGGLVAVNYVGKSKPDGYTLLVATNGMVLATKLYSSTYVLGKPMEDAMIPIYCWVTNDGNGVFVSKKSDIQTIDQLAAEAHKRAVKIALAGGLGTTDQITAIELEKSYGGKWVTVPMNSAAEVAAAVEGGQVDCGEGSPSASCMDPNQIRMLAVTNAERSTRWPDVKTFTELGKPDLKVVFTIGVMAPAGTPPAIVQQLENVFDKARNDPGFLAWAKKTNQPIGSQGWSAAKFKQYLTDYGKQMKGIMPDMEAQLKAAQGTK